MKSLKRDVYAVSPVIATILLVAITVVLAATVWVMLDTGDDGDIPFAADISGEYDGDKNVTVEINSIRTPNTADPGEFEFGIIDAEGEEETIWGDWGDEIDWSKLNDEGEVRSGSEATIDVDEVFDDFETRDELDRVAVFIEGYQGSRTIEL